jgi:hypothetical protein
MLDKAKSRSLYTGDSKKKKKECSAKDQKKLRALYGTRLKTIIVGTEDNNAFMDTLRSNIQNILGKNLDNKMRLTALRLKKREIER